MDCSVSDILRHMLHGSEHHLALVAVNPVHPSELPESVSFDSLASEYPEVHGSRSMRIAFEGALTAVWAHRPMQASFASDQEFHVAMTVFRHHLRHEMDYPMRLADRAVRNTSQSTTLLNQLRNFAQNYEIPEIWPADEPGLSNQMVEATFENGITARGRMQTVTVAIGGQAQYHLTMGETVAGLNIEFESSLRKPTMRVASTSNRVTPDSTSSPRERAESALSNAPTMTARRGNSGLILSLEPERPGPHIPNISSVINRRSVREWAQRTGLLFHNMGPHQLPRGHSYTFTLLRNGEVTYGQANNVWELGIKHEILAADRPVAVAGELRIDANGHIQYNLLSGTFTHELLRMGFTNESALSRNAQAVFRAWGCQNPEFIAGTRSLIPGRFPSAQELQNILNAPELTDLREQMAYQCHNVGSFRFLNPRLCGAL